MTWWVHDLLQQGRTVELISWIFWVIFAITLHELAHGWVAIWQGDDTPRRLNRMTLNPLVHMGGMSLLMLAIIGIAWGVMPTDPSKYRWRRKGRAVVAVAGPAMNIILAFVSLSLLIVWLKIGPTNASVYNNLAMFLWTGGWLNILLAVFNMLPIPPLDGSSVLSGLSYRCYVWFQNPQAQLFGMFAVLAIFFSGIGGLIFGVLRVPALIYVEALGAILGNPSLFDVIAP